MSVPTPDPRAPQLEAADPAGSAWVSANAGSGKTRVLIERVARMLLSGARPHRILCLTYTNAAAAEMQNRLFAMLGEWAMLDDDELSLALRALTEDDAARDTDMLARARRLFAEALETPGGLKIQTIHAFCATILRRFPLEAGVSPRFEVLDDRGRKELMAEARSVAIVQAATGDDPALRRAFDTLTARYAEEALEALFDGVAAHRALFEPEDALQAAFAALGSDPGADWRREALDWRDRLDREALRRAAALMRSGKKTDISGAERIEAVDTADSGDAVLGAAAALLLTKDGAPRKLDRIPTNDIHNAEPWIRPLLEAMQDGLTALQNRIHTIQRAELTEALHLMAQSVLEAYTAAKARTGVLDFDDIIAKTQALLSRSETAAWVLYKLDGGLDHILVDEAQDTSPVQWRVISTLAEEFYAGEGARKNGRTLFVVGDEKQSIYSFQGADPREFEKMRARLSERLARMEKELAEPLLLTSFRSASAILRVVDWVLADPAAKGMSAGRLVDHAAHRDSLKAPGRVDLWPLLPPEEKPEEPPWWEPIDAPGPEDPELRLATTIADEVARWLSDRVVIPGKGRAVTPGDIIILVRRRGKLSREILRRLQIQGVPVAGADRLRIAGHIAVKDLLALAKVALLPEDDLSLAALLRSPLCDVSEEALFDLAHDRGPLPLWGRVMQAPDRHGADAAMLRDMANQADFLRPFEFLQRALIRHDGRRRLIGRLGAEAEDAIDELLSQALIYERAETPSLQGFVEWIESGDPEIKREQQPRDKDDPGAVRVMTVHGAKGLEAPIVILPDTLAPARRATPQILTLEAGGGEIAIAAGAAKDDPAVAAEARAEAQRRLDEERLRLLYVAMTRAEDWLIVCGAGDEKHAESGWYGLVSRAMAVTGRDFASPLSALGLGPGLRVEDAAAASITADDDDRCAKVSASPDAAPDWLTAPLPRDEAAARRLSPSDLGGAHTLPTEDAAAATPEAREQALLRGDLIHRALELAADSPAETQDAIIQRVLRDGATSFSAGDLEQMAAEVRRVLSEPALAEIFSVDALSEPTLWAEIPELGGRKIDARLDRLILRRDPSGAVTVRIIDFKSNRQAPKRVVKTRPRPISDKWAPIERRRRKSTPARGSKSPFSGPPRPGWTKFRRNSPMRLCAAPQQSWRIDPPRPVAA